MLKLAFAYFLQHLQNQNTWAQSLLAPHIGQCIKIDVKLLSATLLVLETGQLTVAGETATADASIEIAPSTLLRLIANDEAAKQQVEITGDTGLATAMAKVLTHLQWDITDDLSHIIGDVASEQLAGATNKAANTLKETVVNLGEMTTEFLQEERLVLAKPHQIQSFNASVEALKSDVARFEKKLEKLNAKVLAQQTD